MRKISNRNEEFSRIDHAVREVKEFVTEHTISSLKLNTYPLNQSAIYLNNGLKNPCKAIQKQDNDRALYSFDSAKSDLVNFQSLPDTIVKI